MKSFNARAVVVALLFTAIAAPVPVAAQQATATVVIAVRDLFGLAIASADVALELAPDKKIAALTNDRGEATLAPVPPGTYSISIASPGFEPASIRVTVRSGGRVAREVQLRIAAIVEEINVAPSAEDRQLTEAFTNTLTPEQIADLPDDPDEALAVLQQLIGSDIELNVNGFVGDAMPRGSQIRDVRIRWNGGADGGPQIELRTQPGGDRWWNDFSFSMRDEAFNARNAMAATRPVGGARQFGWWINGPLVRNRTGLSFALDRSEGLDQQAVRAALPDGTVFTRLASQPSTRSGVELEVEHVMNSAHEIRAAFRHNTTHAPNQGIGEFDLPERAYARDQSDGGLRLAHRVTFGRNVVNDGRLMVNWRSSESRPRTEAQAIRVLDAFNAGGAQVQGGRQSRQIQFEDEFKRSFGRAHQLNLGAIATHAIYHGDEIRNAGGTFTFTSLDTYAVGQPSTYTQRLGNPDFAYTMSRISLSAQDDYRVRRNLMLHFGVRQDMQTHLGDRLNVGPRVAASWTPVASWKTMFRGHFGVYYLPLDASLYEQTLLVDGERLRDVVVTEPRYPNPFAGVVAANRPPSVIRARSDLAMPRNRRWSIGVEQPIGSTRVRVTYARQVGGDQFRSRDVNAPIDGARPDPAVWNVTELESSARTFNQSIELWAAFNYQPRRLSSTVSYTYGEALNDTDGPLTLPPDSHDLSNEWGPSRQDLRHRLNSSLTTQLWHGFRLSANFKAQSAAPYTVTTGVDSNGDGVNNERPDGVGRNSLRGEAAAWLDGTLTWGRDVGRRAPPAGPALDRPERKPTVAAPLYHVEIFVRGQNLLNAVNAQSFSGVLVSPFFGTMTSAGPPRRLMLGGKVAF